MRASLSSLAVSSSPFSVRHQVGFGGKRTDYFTSIHRKMLLKAEHLVTADEGRDDRRKTATFGAQTLYQQYAAQVKVVLIVDISSSFPAGQIFPLVSPPES